jgi:putative transposase
LPRKPYNWYPGAKYHITSRGVRRNALFEDDADRRMYLTLLKAVKEQYNFNLQAYCLMTNHTHLQLETSDTPPDKIMHTLNLRYAKYFNKKYSFSGHVFDNRYFRELIDSIEYELQVSKYIHLNPLRAGLVASLKDYKWSSYRAYILNEKNDLISKSSILSYFLVPQASNYDHYIKAENIPQSYSNINLLGNYPSY